MSGGLSAKAWRTAALSGFTPARRAGSADYMLVHTYMAHHQGMTIVALANVLFDGVAPDDAYVTRIVEQFWS